MSRELVEGGFVLGTHHHTFTAIARCPRTGRLGIAVATGELAVGGRVPFIQANVGAVGTQAYTDPRLGPLALKLLDLGYPAARVLSELQASDPYTGHRQIGVVDRWGHTAVSTGVDNSAWAGDRQGDGWIAMANAVVGAEVVDGMAAALADAEPDVETRLMRAIAAGSRTASVPPACSSTRPPGSPSSTCGSTTTRIRRRSCVVCSTRSIR